MRRTLLMLVAGVAALAVGGASAGPTFDINGYIVGKWRNVDNQHVYVIAKTGSQYEFRAGGTWTSASGCPVPEGIVLYYLIPQQTTGGYLNGGQYHGAWNAFLKDDKGACHITLIAYKQQGYYNGDTGFVPTTGAKTAENPDGQYMNWFCDHSHPYTQCGVLSRIGKGFFETAPPTTTTKPTTTTPGPKPGGTGTLSFTWKVPDRFGLDEDDDGLIDYATSRSSVDPLWSLLVHVNRCASTTAYVFSIGRSLRAEPDEKEGACWFRVSGFPKLGTYTLKVSGLSAVGTRTSGTRTVVLRDWLVVGIGDSAASGEGSPDIPGATDATWEFERCHRSAKSFEAQTALRLEHASDFSSVTFVHLACSGAGIKEGAVGEYFGIAPGGANEPLLAQISEARSLVGNRHVSALIASIGVNDIGFGAVIKFCAGFPDCMNHNYQGTRTLASVIEERLGKLKQNLYPQLAARLRPLVYAGRVYITEYFDPLRDDDGSLCTSILGGIDANEIEYLENVLGKLNTVVQEAAGRFRWNYVGGAEQLFHEHGYCASDNWIVTLGESLRTQARSAEGTLHPNPTGYKKLAGRVFAEVYPNVRTLPPLG